MHCVDRLIISGASVTASAWFTWADHAEALLQPNQVINLAVKGCGNKFIALSLINYVLSNDLPPNTLAMPMFTCVDKFDLYCDAVRVRELAQEKHPPINLSAEYCTAAESGFWSTGSHFPGIKSYYEQHYLDLDWMTTDTIFTLYALQKICQARGITLVCLFDGDIWQHTEKDYNEMVIGKPCQPRHLLDGMLANRFRQLVPEDTVETNSLFEYALDKGLPVYNPICKLHPPSDVHLSWFVQMVLPKIKYCTYQLDPSYMVKIKKFTEEWHTQDS